MSSTISDGAASGEVCAAGAGPTSGVGSSTGAGSTAGAGSAGDAFISITTQDSAWPAPASTGSGTSGSTTGIPGAMCGLSGRSRSSMTTLCSATSDLDASATGPGASSSKSKSVGNGSAGVFHSSSVSSTTATGPDSSGRESCIVADSTAGISTDGDSSGTGTGMGAGTGTGTGMGAGTGSDMDTGTDPDTGGWPPASGTPCCWASWPSRGGGLEIQSPMPGPWPSPSSASFVFCSKIRPSKYNLEMIPRASRSSKSLSSTTSRSVRLSSNRRNTPLTSSGISVRRSASSG